MIARACGSINHDAAPRSFSFRKEIICNLFWLK